MKFPHKQKNFSKVQNIILSLTVSVGLGFSTTLLMSQNTFAQEESDTSESIVQEDDAQIQQEQDHQVVSEEERSEKRKKRHISRVTKENPLMGQAKKHLSHAIGLIGKLKDQNYALTPKEKAQLEALEDKLGGQMQGLSEVHLSPRQKPWDRFKEGGAGGYADQPASEGGEGGFIDETIEEGGSGGFAHESSSEDCMIDPSSSEATCNGQVYIRIEDEVVGEFEFPEEFERVITEVPRDFRKEYGETYADEEYHESVRSK